MPISRARQFHRNPAQSCHRRKAKTAANRRKIAPVTSSHRMPPTRRKGRKKPPMPRLTPRPAWVVNCPAACPAARFGTAELVPCWTAWVWAAAAPDCAWAASRCPAMRPATRTPMPTARPRFRGLIPFMMVAAACGALRSLPQLPGCSQTGMAVRYRVPFAATRACTLRGSRSWRKP